MYVPSLFGLRRMRGSQVTGRMARIEIFVTDTAPINGKETVEKGSRDSMIRANLALGLQVTDQGKGNAVEIGILAAVGYYL